MCTKTLQAWCLTLCDPTDCSPPGSSVHGLHQARILEWVVPFSRRPSQARDQSCFSCHSCTAGRLPLSHQKSYPFGPLHLYYTQNSYTFKPQRRVYSCLDDSPTCIFAPFNLFPTKSQTDPSRHVQSCHSFNGINCSLRINHKVLTTARSLSTFLLSATTYRPFTSLQPHWSQFVHTSTCLLACDNLTSDFQKGYYSLVFSKSLLTCSLLNETIPLKFHPPHALFFFIAVITS